MQQKSVRTVEYSYRGEPVPEMNAEPEKVMSEVLDEIKKSALQEKIFEPVTSRKAQRQEARLMKESIIERIVYFIGLNIGVVVYFCDTNIGALVNGRIFAYQYIVGWREYSKERFMTVFSDGRRKEMERLPF